MTRQGCRYASSGNSKTYWISHIGTPYKELIHFTRVLRLPYSNKKSRVENGCLSSRSLGVLPKTPRYSRDIAPSAKQLHPDVDCRENDLGQPLDNMSQGRGKSICRVGLSHFPIFTAIRPVFIATRN